MSIHNLRYNVKLIKIAMGNKEIFEKMPRFWRFKQLCARHRYVCRHGLYVVYIVTQTPSFRRKRDLDKSNTFRQMQELTNDYYSVIDLFRGACAVKGNVQVAGHVKPAPFSRRDVTLGDVDGSLFHIKI